MKNAKTLAVAVLLLAALVLACGGGKPAPVKYQGNWVGADGSTMYLNSDGGAGFKIGGKEVTGGGAEFDESGKSFKISLFGISETFKIDEEPNEKGEMKLNGVVYKRR
ncbi:MAG: hypothetical protein IPN69_20910 [Acidobacteria bacterium]|nr:hypothetical protein [Acidobacteriota bacterium]MBK8813169.1 hypothetical protein [Acidobacteriota bacterium]